MWTELRNDVLAKVIFISIFIFSLGCSRLSSLTTSLIPASQQTIVVKGTYHEYLVENQDGTATLFSSIEDENHNAYQFQKSSGPINDLIGIQPNDKVQIEFARNSKIDQFIRAAQTANYSQIKIQPLALKKLTSNNDVVLKQSDELTGEVDLTVAIVYLDYSDFKAPTIDTELPANVKKIITDSTWGAIRLHVDETDVYRIQVKSPYPGCDSWNQMGGTAIQYVNNVLKKNYNRVVAIVPNADTQNNCYWAGITNSGQSYASPNPSPIVSRTSSNRVVAHELGHTLGLGHSARTDAGTYGDNQDTMGRGLGLNIPKLVDLRVLQDGKGITAIEANTNTYTIYGKTTNVFDTKKDIAYQMGGFYVSLSEKYGLTIHSRTGFGAIGNEPSSNEVAKLLPGDYWESPNQTYKVQFLKWDLVNNSGVFKVNSPNEESGGYVGGCMIDDMSMPTVALADRYSDSNSGFIEFSAYSFGNVGDCKSEEFTVDVIPVAGQVITLSQFKIVKDVKSNNTVKFMIPFLRTSNATEFSIKTLVSYKGKLLNEKVTKLAPYECQGSSFQSCSTKLSCNIPATVSAVLDKQTTTLSKLEGYLVVVNPNEETCGTGQYEIKLSDISAAQSNASLSEDDIEFANALNSSADSSYLVKKSLFLKPGEAVKLPLKIQIKNSNQNALLRIYTIGIAPARTFGSIDLAWSDTYGGITNLYSYPSVYTPHPHQPQALNAFHVTGQESLLKPFCQVDTFVDGQFKNTNQVDIVQGGSLRLLVTKKYATAVEYNCNNGGWKALTLNSQNEFSTSGFQENLNCKLRAVRLQNGQSITNDCTPNSTLNIRIVKGDEVSCQQQAQSPIEDYTMSASLKISDANKGKIGLKYILAKTPENTWYSYTLDLGWVTGQLPYVNGAHALTDTASFYLFKNMNLTAFKGTNIFMGYGVGNTSSSAYSEMLSQNRFYSCKAL